MRSMPIEKPRHEQIFRFRGRPFSRDLAEPGWQIWFRAGRRVHSVWGAAPSGIYVLALDLEKDA